MPLEKPPEPRNADFSCDSVLASPAQPPAGGAAEEGDVLERVITRRRQRFRGPRRAVAGRLDHRELVRERGGQRDRAVQALGAAHRCDGPASPGGRGGLLPGDASIGGDRDAGAARVQAVQGIAARHQEAGHGTGLRRHVVRLGDGPGQAMVGGMHDHDSWSLPGNVRRSLPGRDRPDAPAARVAAQQSETPRCTAGEPGRRGPAQAAAGRGQERTPCQSTAHVNNAVPLRCAGDLVDPARGAGSARAGGPGASWHRRHW